jgi:hypothetical protein
MQPITIIITQKLGDDGNCIHLPVWGCAGGATSPPVRGRRKIGRMEKPALVRVVHKRSGTGGAQRGQLHDPAQGWQGCDDDHRGSTTGQHSAGPPRMAGRGGKGIGPHAHSLADCRVGGLLADGEIKRQPKLNDACLTPHFRIKSVNLSSGVCHAKIESR